MINLPLLALLATLASGFMTITLLAVGRRARRFEHKESFIVSILLFNLIVILGLAWKALPGPPSPRLLLAVLLVLGGLKIAWIYSLIVISIKILDRPVPRAKPFFLIPAGVMALLGGIAWIPSFGARFAGNAAAVFEWLEYIFIAAVIGIGGFTAVGSRRRPLGLIRKASFSLGLILFLFFSASLLILILGRASGDFGASELANALGLLLFNPALLLWVHAHADAFPAATAAEFHAPADIQARHGLTDREIEIVALVCQGKTNREIADALHISPQTVKDHNYNIFRKTDVRNRTQLARLFMR